MNEEITCEDWYDRAIALRDEGKIDEAIAELERLVERWPDYALAHLALAVFYERSGRPNESMDSVKRACLLETDNPFYFTAASALAIRAGRRQEAEEALMKAQEARFAESMKKMAEEKNDTEEQS